MDDLLRLECLLPERKGQHIFRYLIIAGRTNDLREKFLNAPMNYAQVVSSSSMTS